MIQFREERDLLGNHGRPRRRTDSEPGQRCLPPWVAGRRCCKYVER